MRGWLSCSALLLILAGPVLAQSGVACVTCHEQGKQIQGSTHATVECATCHPRHENFPHPAGVPKPQCAQCHSQVAAENARGVHGQAKSAGNAAAPDCAMCHGNAHSTLRPSSQQFRQAVPETCGMCHANEAGQFRASVHGKALAAGNSSAPICTDCHGEHSIIAPRQSASLVNPEHIRETCGRCHGDVRLSRKFGLPADRVISFDASFHGMAARSGSQAAANCASCHGYHNILPSSDPKSTISAKNLPATCGKCHPGAGTSFALGSVHLMAGGKEPVGVRWVRLIYLILIPAVIGLMLLHNIADWFRKVYRLRIRPVAASRAARPPELRMYTWERVQHLLLLTSFAVLVWTGFALKYPDQFWARPLLVWETYFPVRATIHRIAGAIMIVVSLLHLVTLAASRKLRGHWFEMWPRFRDVSEAVLNFMYLLGLRAEKPRLSSHGYVEKAEYWAVVWGTFVMGLTGLMLWGVNYTLAWLPKSWLDIATALHFYEAVLATLAILVWHFYFVIFDPEVYPMDTAWLNGQGVREREPHDS